MPRRTHPKRSTHKRPTWDPDEKELSYDEMAMRLVKAGLASPRVLGALHPRMGLGHLTDQTDHSNERNDR